MVGWQYWQYCGCSDPTTQGPGDTQAIVKDPAKAPVGDNVEAAKLQILARPYPQLVAGTPKAWRFDPAARVFTLRYSTARAGGGSFSGSPETEIYVPRSQFPAGYGVTARGAGVVSPVGAQLLRLRACPGAREVSVRVAEDAQPAEDCAGGAVAGIKVGLPQLRISVAPKRARSGRATTFVFRVRAGRYAVRAARVRFAGHTARTNGRGVARIRVRLRRTGVRRAVAWKRTFRRGVVHVRVVR
jgi:hypothetical protein